MDPTMTQDWSVSNLAPPFGQYPMMNAGGMMGGSPQMWGASMKEEPPGGSIWSWERGSTARTLGQFWCFCMYPTDALRGMHGSFVLG